MTKNKKGLKAAVIAVVICAAAVTVFLVNRDAIMRKVAPNMYIVSRAANSYKELEKENNALAINDVAPIGGNHSMDGDVSLNGVGITFNEQYDCNTPQLYATGKLTDSGKSHDFQCFLNNDKVGVCLPEYADMWLTAASKSFGAAWNKSPVVSLVPISISKDLSVQLPKKSDAKPTDDIYSIISKGIEQVKISNVESENDTITYDVSVPRSVFCSVLYKITDFYKNDEAFNQEADAVGRLAGAEDFKKSVTAMFEQLESGEKEENFPETIAISAAEKNKRLVKVSTDIKLGDDILKMWADMSKKARMYDSADLGITYTLDGEDYGIKYTSGGNLFYRNEKLSKETNIDLYLPFAGRTLIDLKYDFSDANSYTYSISANNDLLGNFGSSGSGTEKAGELTINADKCDLKFKGTNLSVTGGITLKKRDGDLSVPHKIAYTLK